MSLEEAINRNKEAAEIWKLNLANRLTEEGRNECKKCAEEHEQLAEWLRELQQFRKYKKWLLEEQYKRKDSLVFGDGVRYCAERLERQFESMDKE